jgi:hypothetical protein
MAKKKLTTGQKVLIGAGAGVLALWGWKKYKDYQYRKQFGGNAVMSGLQGALNMPTQTGSSSGSNWLDWGSSSGSSSGSGSIWDALTGTASGGAFGTAFGTAGSNLPRGLKNNNPLNLILTSITWQGKVPNAQNTDGKFEQFQNILLGYRAGIKNLKSYIDGGANTISKITSKWAPTGSGEGNNPENYARRVSQGTGIGSTAQIPFSKQYIVPIVREMAVVENGESFRHLIKDSDIETAFGMI